MTMYEELEQEVLENWKKMQERMTLAVKKMDDLHNQEIRAYIEKAVADIARKCGVEQSEVWQEMNYWSKDKG